MRGVYQTLYAIAGAKRQPDQEPPGRNAPFPGEVRAPGQRRRPSPCRPPNCGLLLPHPSLAGPPLRPGPGPARGRVRRPGFPRIVLPGGGASPR